MSQKCMMKLLSNDKKYYVFKRPIIKWIQKKIIEFTNNFSINIIVVKLNVCQFI